MSELDNYEMDGLRFDRNRMCGTFEAYSIRSLRDDIYVGSASVVGKSFCVGLRGYTTLHTETETANAFENEAMRVIMLGFAAREINKWLSAPEHVLAWLQKRAEEREA